ncbi:hypothetical protein [Streptomyces sp. A0592]|uniref:hypothetical protein n=1 Tax=Streptomyces sp. A0592 TaxID=2563099 RepID=UPI00109EC6CA|nr:hypothetical protein [Streptomyces sp. A0592]THA81661.1 hypothetical protein E6U81_23315 [Streptomyces sp. A0592]
MGESEDAIVRADRQAFTAAPPKPLTEGNNFLQDLKTPREVAAELGLSQRSVECYLKGEGWDAHRSGGSIPSPRSAGGGPDS